MDAMIHEQITWHEVNDHERANGRPAASCMPIIVRADFCTMDAHSGVRVPRPEYYIAYDVDEDGNMSDASGNYIDASWDAVTWVGVFSGPIAAAGTQP